MKQYLPLRTWLVSLGLVLCFISEAKTIYYVKENATGTGTSWANAAGNIQTMIDKAVSGDEVWVAKGTYYPTTERVARDARSRSILMKDGVSIYGGFGGTETAIAQRALSDLDGNGRVDSCELTNTTLISGDIDGVADVWTKTMNSDGKTWEWTVAGNEGNCYQVVICQTDFTKQTNIDGFSVYGGNANVTGSYSGGGIYAKSKTYVTNCTVSNCSASSDGGGVYVYVYSSSSYVTNCTVSNCSASSNGGGVYVYVYSSSSSSYVTNCTVSNCSASNGGGVYASSYSYIINCTVSNCSASNGGGGVFASSSFLYVINCMVSNCSASNGGGVYSSSSSSYVTNCMVSNCSASSNGGGVYAYASYIINCMVSNCSASNGGGVYASSSYSYSSYVTNCSVSNNKVGTNISNVVGGTQSGNISPDLQVAYIKPTSFVGTAITDAQNAELHTADWHLKEGSPCINAGTSANVSSTILNGIDLDGKARVRYGTIDIGAYEYIAPLVAIPVNDDFNNWTDFEKSELFYRSAKINTLNYIKWTIENQKAIFSWQTNFTTSYTQPIFTYQIDATKTSKVILRYDMYFEAYSGTISPLGTEKLNVEVSTDLVTWTNVATYSNQNGTIPNKTYLYDISSQVAGKTFFVRFNANGANSNRIEKWEIDNVIIDTDGNTALAVSQSKQEELSCAVIDGRLLIQNVDNGTTIQLYDVNGRLLGQRKAESVSTVFELPQRGVYIVKSVIGNVNISEKVVW